MASASDFSTHVVLPYARQAETRAAALRVLERTGNADVAEALGLVDDPGSAAVDGRQACPRCHKPLPDPISNGGHKPYRRRACVAAAAAGSPDVPGE